MQQAVHSTGRLPRPRFVTLAANYPKKSMSRADLYEELGIGVLTNNPAYENTCGIRMSYAIAKSGVILGKGGLRINKGPLKGRRIEPGMRKLAEHLGARVSSLRRTGSGSGPLTRPASWARCVKGR